jgi:hypothetical protein
MAIERAEIVTALPNDIGDVHDQITLLPDSVIDKPAREILE